MRKWFIFFLVFSFLLFGCEKKKEESILETKNVVIHKIDESKDYVYFEDLKQITDTYTLKYAFINLDSENVSTVNFELKNFVNTSYKSMVFTDTTFEQGNIISYESFVSNNYISLIQNVSYYIQSSEKNPKSFIYVIDKNTGSLLSNQEILKRVSMSEEDLFSYLLQYNGLEDNLYTVSILKNDGYQLYFNSQEKLVLRYYDVHNDGVEKKELVLT